MRGHECVFCQIVRGRAEASVVDDDATVLAIMDVRPVTTGHVLVLPKAHVPGLEELDPGLGVAGWGGGAPRRAGAAAFRAAL